MISIFSIASLEYPFKDGHGSFSLLSDIIDVQYRCQIVWNQESDYYSSGEISLFRVINDYGLQSLTGGSYILMRIYSVKKQSKLTGKAIIYLRRHFLETCVYSLFLFTKGKPARWSWNLNILIKVLIVNKILAKKAISPGHEFGKFWTILTIISRTIEFGHLGVILIYYQTRPSMDG